MTVATPEVPDVGQLVRVRGQQWVGSNVLGLGFTLTPEQAADLIARAPST